MNEVWKKPPISLDAYQAMVGKEIGVSSWHLVDQPRIDTYADVIEDHQFIHVDPERAKKETAFGTTIAHGFLTMSLLSIMSYEVMPVIAGTTMGVNYITTRFRQAALHLAGALGQAGPRPLRPGGSQAAQGERAAVPHQRHGGDRRRRQARAGRGVAWLDLFRLG
ncbi:acyl dehydratase [Bradyrhizobium sp. LB13.1]